MEYTLEQLMTAVGCPQYPLRWVRIFDKAMARCEEGGNPLTDPAFYDRLQAQYGCMDGYLELYKEAAARTAGDEALSRFLQLLVLALEDRECRQQDIRELGLLNVSTGRDPMAYNMVTGLAVCSQLDDANEKLTERGFPEDFRRSCLRSAVSCGVNSYMRLHNGAPGYRLLGWAQHYLAGRLCMVGRLEAEFFAAFQGHGTVYQDPEGRQVILAKGIRLHRSGFILGSRHYEDEDGAWEPGLEETESTVTGHAYLENGAVSREKTVLPRCRWKPVLTHGDPVISLHIPDRPGKPLTPEAVDSALREIRQLARTLRYPFKAFVCCSWLMDPQLDRFLEPGSNIARFSRRFRKLTVKSAGTSVFVFLFKRPESEPDIRRLPENSRLERGIKAHYLEGRAIYEVLGVLTETDSSERSPL